MAKKEFTAEERAEYAAKRQAETEAMFKRIDEGVNAVFTSEKYMEYLKFASKFTDYSARNTMLINMQRPDATFVAAFGTWKKMGRFVQKGEAGIEILAPVTYKTNQYIEFDRPATDEFGNQLYNEDGTEKMETVQKALTGLAFKPTYVFDLSQTEGKPIPDPFTELQGDIDSAKKEAIFKALEKVTGIPIEFQDIQGGAKGYYSPMQNKIVIKTGMSDLQTLKTAFHETAHSLLHDPDKKIVTVKAPRNEKEVHAESVAFMVAEKFGMDTSDYSFPYIASWSEGKQKDQLMRALDEIQDAAKAITSAVEWELLKMRKRDLSIEEKLADTELNNVQKAELLIEDYADKGFHFTKEDTDRLLETAADNEDIYRTVNLANDIVMIQQQRDSYGYDFTGMIPFENKETALAAFDRGEAVYLLYPDNTEGMAIERSEIENFDGYFGVEKEEKEEKSIAADEHLVLVSKEVALEMWDKDLDVFIDGVPAFSRDDIVKAPDEAQIHLAEYQYTAELDFDKPARGYGKERKVTDQNVSNQPKTAKNPNIIGNTPYAELGDKSSLMYYPNLKNRHADNIAKQLDADHIRFSGVRKGEVTTITINKADIKRYERAVEKVKESYRNPEKAAEPVPDRKEAAPAPEAPAKPLSSIQSTNPNIIGNTPYAELGGRNEVTYYSGLKNRHADNIAKQLNEDGVRFSGVRKGETTTITINKADVERYEAAVEKVKESYRQADKPKEPVSEERRATVTKPEQTARTPRAAAPAPVNPNIIGNTPYTELGNRTELKYFTGLNARHADNIAKQLDSDGVRFSGVKKSDGTVTITINKADIQLYDTAVEQVKEMYRNADRSRLSGEISHNASSSAPDSSYGAPPPEYGESYGAPPPEYGESYGTPPPEYDYSNLEPPPEQPERYAEMPYNREEPPVAPQAAAPTRTEPPTRAARPAMTDNPNVIGNTPYWELGGRSEVTYYTNLKNRHADSIAKQLNAEGIHFSGLRKGTITTITINKADIPRYEAAVEKVKASYRAAPVVRQPVFMADMPQKPKAPKPVIPEQRPDLPASLADIPICKQSFLEAKQSGNEQGWRDSVAASKACVNYLNDHLYDAYEARNLKGLVKDMEEKFGLDRTMYTIAATIQLKDHDGRFSREAKERAREYPFDSDRARLAFLTEAHPVMLCHFYECLIDREKELNQPQIEAEKNKDKLPSHLADKFLFSSERVELREDYRGIPETHFYKSSANEYHVEGYGWISDADYEKKQKESGLSVKEFAAKIDMVNANYVSVDGRAGQVDMTKDEYDLLTEKTYSPENKESFAAARFAFEKRLQELGGIADKPTEYYAVRQSVSDRYDICTIGKGNIVVPIKCDMATIAEAKKALLELYKERQTVARVELVHPQTLIERAAELRKENPAPKHEPNFEIYQLRVTDENADLSFRSMDDLMKQGKKPKFSSYEKVYEGHTTDLRIHEGSVAETLEDIFCKFNIERPHDFKGHSLSVSDVVVLMDKAYYVDSAGFKALGNFLPPEREKNKFLADLTGMVAALSDKSDMELTESVAEIHKKAAKLGVEPAILREALYMSDEQRVAAAVEQYETGGRKGTEPPKQEKPINNKKLKL
ncbi:YodL domain-containing protein [Ruminococcus sp.]|uniref:YodL domain-containing protein n=1 Tax=Ruminococcus sp. TaxID=41978 RepID=UPI0025DAFF2B|nr:YodL domain-containing protein [Ruminococcus sp.]MBR1433111.1 DUF3849 domain-containing protein [Ruminococcus sp.]